MTTIRYDPQRFDGQRYTEANVAFWTDRFVQLGEIDPDDLVLDVGCATGGFTDALHAVGIERSGPLAAHARANHPGLRLCRGAADSLPVRDASVDVVIASLLLHQLDDPDAAIGEVARVLRRGGRLVVRTVTPDDAAAWLPHTWFPTLVAVQRARMPALDTLRSQIAAAGFAAPVVTTVERELTVDADRMVQTAEDTIARHSLDAEEIAQGMRAIRAADGVRYLSRHVVLVARLSV